MNPLISSLIKFTVVTVLIGSLSLLVYPAILAFAIGAAVAIVLQLLIGWVINSYREIKLQEYAFQVRLDEKAILEANTLSVNCAGCKTPNSIPIIVSERNLFSCRKCGVENTIMISTETALTTNLDES